jgi:hypothetical protein
MKVLSIPRGLRWAAAAVFLTVPIAASQSMVMARAPWWALPIRPMEVAALWACVCSVFISGFLLRGRRSFYWVLVGAGVLWLALSALAAVRTQNPGMGFFTIFLGVYFGLMTSWVKLEFERSFFDPNMHWFEGAPNSISSLSCEVVADEKKVPAKVSRLDEEGAFVFVEGTGIPLSKSKSELVFRFRDREVRCFGRPMLIFKRNAEGVGFRFDGNTPDQKKELGDFIEALRGEGYV